MKGINRTYVVSMLVTNTSTNIIEGKEQAKEVVEGLGLRVENVEHVPDKRTIKQNNSLHLLLSQTSKEAVEKGVDMRMVVKDDVPIECTPENLKWLWKKIQKHLFGYESTKDLESGQINTVYDNLNKLLIDRTNGELSLPPFPSKNDK